MAEQSGAGSSVFTRGFLPGLVLGVVIGAVVGFLSTEILGRTGKIPLDGASPMGTVTERDQEGEPAMTREELERLATEAAAEAAAKAVREQQEGTTEEEPPVEVPSEDPADGRDDG